MLNSQYIDAIQTVGAYNNLITGNGYTQIPMDQTANFFKEVYPDDNDDIDTALKKRLINENSQYYRNGSLQDYQLTVNNCVTTTINPILRGIVFKNLNAMAAFTVYRLKGQISPSVVRSILDDDVNYFHGEGLVSWRGYQEVPG